MLSDQNYVLVRNENDKKIRKVSDFLKKINFGRFLMNYSPAKSHFLTISVIKFATLSVTFL